MIQDEPTRADVDALRRRLMLSHERRELEKSPMPVIVELDADGDPWLKMGRHARRLLTRDEFFELARRGGMTVIPAK